MHLDGVFHGLHVGLGKRSELAFEPPFVGGHDLVGHGLSSNAMAPAAVSNDAANRHLARVVVVPLTSNTGRIYPGEAVVTVGG